MALDPSIPLGVRTQQQPFNNPFEQLLELRNQKQRQQLIDQQIRSGQAAEEARRQDTAKQAAAEAAQARYFDIIRTSKSPDEIEARVQTETPELFDGFREQRQKLDKLAADINAQKQAAEKAKADIASKGMEFAGPLFQLVESSGNDPGVFDSVLNITKGYFADFPADKYREMAGGDPARIGQIVQGMKSPTQQNADVNAATAAAQIPGMQADSEVKQQVAAGTREGLTPNQRLQAQPKPPPEPNSIDEMIAAAFKANDGKAINELLTVKAKMAAATRDPKAAPTASEAGWSIQQASDPATNTTRMMRVNSRTGEVQEVKLPGDLQAGGQRQTRLTAGQQEDLATMATVQDMSKELTRLGEKIGWQGVGGMGYGTVAEFLTKQFGTGSEDAVKLRALVGNVKGTIAKLRGGTSFTANEQKLLDTYTPGINESVLSIKAKLAGLDDFIETKRKNTMKFAGADMGAGASKTQESDAVEEWVRDPKTGKLMKKAK